MSRVRDGDALAAREIFETFGDLLFRVVRRHLNPALRPQFDSADLVQEAWLAFLQDPTLNPDFETPRQFGAFLALVARNKAIDAVRRGLMTAGHNLNREIRISANPIKEDLTPAHFETPSKSAMRRELKDVLLQGLPPAYQIVGLRILSGIDPSAIAEETGVSQRTVERIRKRIVDQLHLL